MIKNILFDLDGTLLPMDMEKFTNGYFKLLVAKILPLEIDGKEFINNIWAGTKCMVKNDGKRSNEEAFWEYFSKVYGDKTPAIREICEEFYANEFDGGRAFTGFNDKVKALVDDVKKAGFKVILATNPLFPNTATVKRTSWAGLSVDDFEGHTTYENSSYCKPNPKYYEEVCERFGLNPKECLMVGNDAEEDLAALKTGMSVYLITDCLINNKNVDISDIPHGNFDNLRQYLQL